MGRELSTIRPTLLAVDDWYWLRNSDLRSH